MKRTILFLFVAATTVASLAGVRTAAAHNTCSATSCCSPHAATGSTGGGYFSQCSHVAGTSADYNRRFRYDANNSIAKAQCGSNMVWCGCSYSNGTPKHHFAATNSACDTTVSACYNNIGSCY